MMMKVTIPAQTIGAEDLFDRGIDKIRTVMCAMFGGEVAGDDLDSLAGVLEQALKDLEYVRPAVQEANR
ncbi:hypothetical protein [Mesorhizobium sp. KR1-2]|uniref:hypothetical protein n=1 Tax=Mesorhizobium sp. KR1-2 TaxID=3156609 RepID=UPI0032B3B20B